jgi:hypothetical protein
MVTQQYSLKSQQKVPWINHLQLLSAVALPPPPYFPIFYASDPDILFIAIWVVKTFHGDKPWGWPIQARWGWWQIQQYI